MPIYAWTMSPGQFKLCTMQSDEEFFFRHDPARYSLEKGQKFGTGPVGIKLGQNSPDPNRIPTFCHPQPRPTTLAFQLTYQYFFYLKKILNKKRITNKLPPCQFGLKSFVIALVELASQFRIILSLTHAHLNIYICLLRHEGSKKALYVIIFARSEIWRRRKNCGLCTETENLPVNIPSHTR